MSVALALLSSLLWGVSDFLGGTAAKRLRAAAVVGGSQAIALVGLLAFAVAIGKLDDILERSPVAAPGRRGRRHRRRGARSLLRGAVAGDDGRHRPGRRARRPAAGRRRTGPRGVTQRAAGGRHRGRHRGRRPGQRTRAVRRRLARGRCCWPSVRRSASGRWRCCSSDGAGDGGRARDRPHHAGHVDRPAAGRAAGGADPDPWADRAARPRGPAAADRDRARGRGRERLLRRRPRRADCSAWCRCWARSTRW